MSASELFREDAYLKTCRSTVTATGDDWISFDQTVFYPLGGGQPGDTGHLAWGSQSVVVIDTRYGDNGDIAHFVEPGTALPEVGTQVDLEIDWERRYRHMRMHTAMHLLGAVLRYDVTGGNISTEKCRLDFNMEDTVDKAAVASEIETLIAADHAVSCRWISEAELDQNPQLIRTMSVKPPRGKGAVRLLEIASVDLQPCGGTHVARTAEVGAVRIGKVEKKGRQNRRVNIHLDD